MVFSSRVRVHVLGLTAAVLLSACGGGGGGTETPALSNALVLNTSNQEQVARSAMGAVGIGLMALDLSGSNGSSRAFAALDSTPRRHLLAAGGAKPLAITRTDTPCPLGGKIAVELNDANNNQDLDAGDSLRLDMQACRSLEGTMNGRMDLRVKEFSKASNGASSGLMEIQFTELMVTEANGDQSGGNGIMSIRVSETALGVVSVRLEAPRFTRSERVAGVTNTDTVENLVVDLVEEPRPVARTTARFSGRISASQWGGRSVELSTEPALVTLGSDSYPSSGTLNLVGASSRMRLVALNASQVRLDLDANGDGSFESSVTKRWDDWL